MNEEPIGEMIEDRTADGEARLARKADATLAVAESVQDMQLAERIRELEVMVEGLGRGIVTIEGDRWVRFAQLVMGVQARWYGPDTIHGYPYVECGFDATEDWRWASPPTPDHHFWRYGTAPTMLEAMTAAIDAAKGGAE